MFKLAFGWSFAPRWSFGIVVTGILALASIVMLALSFLGAIWRAFKHISKKETAPWIVYASPALALVIALLPLLFLAGATTPRSPEPSDSSMKQQWEAHSDEIKAINEDMLKYSAGGKYKIVTFDAHEESVLGRDAEWPWTDRGSGTRLSNPKDAKKLRARMDKLNIWKASVRPDGAWYQVRTGRIPFVFRGYYFYNAERWPGESLDLSADARLKRASSVSSLIRLSDDWCIFTEVAGK